jgi:hypothetical protein
MQENVAKLPPNRPQESPFKSFLAVHMQTSTFISVDNFNLKSTMGMSRVAQSV